MTQSEMKELKNIGAELGAAKAENEKLREALKRIIDRCEAFVDDKAEMRTPSVEVLMGIAEDAIYTVHEADDALSQQAEPAEPAPAQDEREAFESHMRLGGYSNTEKHQEGSYVSSVMELWWQGWKARATRPAQTEQQPPYPHEAMDVIATSRYQVVASGSGPLSRYYVRAGDGKCELYRGGKSDCEHVARKLAGAFLDGGLTAFGLYAAPIAQTAPQPEQSGKFAMHQRVRKTSGSEWQGRICGTYSTALTPEGYAVESEAHAGSVQIYPDKALEAVK